MAQYLYKLTASRVGMLTSGPDEREATALAAHTEYLQGLLQGGTAILFGRTQTTDESTFGLVIFDADTTVEARTVMENDPCVRTGVMVAELYPFSVAGLRGSN